MNPTAPRIENQSKKLILQIGCALGLSALIGTYTTPYMATSSFAYFCLLLGFSYRKSNRNLHIRFMSSTILLDLSVVLILELTRSAINTAVSLDLTPLQLLHVSCSSIALALYFPAAIVGYMRHRGKLSSAKSFKAHKNIGFAIMLFRSLGFILMFSMLGR